MTNVEKMKPISSALTILYKFIIPGLWIPGFGIGSYTAIINQGDWIFPIAWIVGTLFILTFCIPLKRVSMDEKNLYISNYLREITVPLHDIKEVTQMRWINIRPVKIYFANSTPFGDRIMFMPKISFSAWSLHPIVDELKQHIIK